MSDPLSKMILPMAIALAAMVGWSIGLTWKLDQAIQQIKEINHLLCGMETVECTPYRP